MGITVDKGAFGRLSTEDDEWSESIVVHATDPHAALAALRSAAERMMCVPRDGVERTPDEVSEHGDLSTPNYAHASLRDDGLPQLYVDCKSLIGGKRSSTLRRIVKQELAAAGINDATVTPSPEDVARAAELLEEERPHAWVEFSDARLPGFPDGLRPASLVVVHEIAHIDWFTTRFTSVEYDGSWYALLVMVADESPESVVESLAAAAEDFGVSGGRSASYEDELGTGVVWRAEQPWGDIEVMGFALTGLKGKPTYLRRRPEAPVVAMSVIQRPPTE